MDDGSNQDLNEVPPGKRGVFTDPDGRRVYPRHRRRAMRQAKQMGFAPQNSDEALWILKDAGLDVFAEGENLLDMVNPEQGGATPDDGDAVDGGVLNLPVRGRSPEHSQISPMVLTPEERDIEIAQIQRDLVKRRRRRMTMLIFRLLLFVVIPTAFFGYYYYNVATPMYETRSEFVIQISDSSSGASTSMLSSSFATVQDSIIVQDYLLSREAFLRLEETHGYAAVFQDEGIDPLQRLPADASQDAAYVAYQDNVTIGYDPTEGVIRMRVIAPTPQLSQEFSESLVGYAEERVDGLSLEARGDQLEIAQFRYEKAEQDMLDAQQKVLDLQQQRGVLSIQAEITSQMGLITTMEGQLEERRLALAEVLENERPNPIREQALRREIGRLESRVRELRASLTETTEGSLSLARISAELSIAESELAIREALLGQTLEQVETAMIEANRQVRYLSVAIRPIAPVEPTYPRKFEDTLLAGLIFLGIYIVLSLTVSILREQISV